MCSVSVLSGQGFAWAVSIPNWRAFRNLVLGVCSLRFRFLIVYTSWVCLIPSILAIFASFFLLFFDAVPKVMGL